MTCLEQIYHPSVHNHLLYRAIHPLFLEIFPILLLSCSWLTTVRLSWRWGTRLPPLKTQRTRVLLPLGTPSAAVSGISRLSLDDMTADR